MCSLMPRYFLNVGHRRNSGQNSRDEPGDKLYKVAVLSPEWARWQSLIKVRYNNNNTLMLIYILYILLHGR